MHFAYYDGLNVLQNQFQVITLRCCNIILKIVQVYG